MHDAHQAGMCMLVANEKRPIGTRQAKREAKKAWVEGEWNKEAKTSDVH